MKLARRAFLMLMALGAIFAFWTLFQDGFHRWILPQAHGASCSWIRSQVEKYGQAAVEAEAKRRGMTDEQIEALRKRCGI